MHMCVCVCLLAPVGNCVHALVHYVQGWLVGSSNFMLKEKVFIKDGDLKAETDREGKREWVSGV